MLVPQVESSLLLAPNSKLSFVDEGTFQRASDIELTKWRKESTFSGFWVCLTSPLSFKLIINTMTVPT